MNMHRSKLMVAVAGALLVGACYTVPQRPAALDDARFAVDAARGNPQVTEWAPAELNDAVAFYQKAEATLRNDGDTAEVRHLAYLARQLAAVAQEAAGQRAAEQAVATANTAARAAQLAEARAEGARQSALEAERRAMAAQRQAELSRQDARSAQEQARASELRRSGLEGQLRDLAATRSDRGLVVTMNDVLFGAGSATLRPGGVRLVNRMAEFLGEYPERTIAIEGFTDSVGSDAYNLELSARRAEEVRLALMDAGIASPRIIVRGYGPAFPVASNDTPEGRLRNRRVEVVISDAGGGIRPRVAYVVPLR